jgi:hypothetical protein
MKPIKVLTLVLAFALLTAATIVMRPAYAQGNPIYMRVDPASITNPALTPGSTFLINVSLYNATVDNIPAGVGGIEIHLSWNNSVIRPLSFVDKITAAGGVFSGLSVLYGLSPGFFDSSDTRISAPPFTNAVTYKVGAASSAGPWWGTGMIVTINFTVVSVGTSDLTFTFTDLADVNAQEVNHDAFNGVFDNRAAPPPSFTLTVNVFGNGTVTKNPNNPNYLSGTIVTLTAIPDVNWTLQGWSGDLSGSQTPVNITMNGNKIVNATFVPIPPGGLNYTLTVIIVGNGTVTESPVAASYLSGTVVTLTAIPGVLLHWQSVTVNWTFLGWSGDLNSLVNPANIVMDGNKTVNATFVIPGDLNGDGKVNLMDLTKFASWYGMTSSNPLWNVASPPWISPGDSDLALADPNGHPQGKINLVDLVTLGFFYSKSPF